MSSITPSLPPQTPTRALLSRLRCRSSLMPCSDTINPHDSPRFAPSSIAEEDDCTIDDQEDFRRLEKQVDQLLLESKDKDREIERLRAQIQTQSQGSKTNGSATVSARAKAAEGVAGKTTHVDSSGLTQEAVKVKREFEAQEMIIKGLQRDNESKTVEVEQFRRQMRTISDFLTRQCGHDWEDVVFGGNGAASGQATTIPADLDEDPLSTGAGTMAKQPSHIAQTLSGQSANLPKMASTPNARRASPLKRMAFLHKDNGSSTDDDDDETSFSSAAAATPSNAFQSKTQANADDSFEAYILDSKSSIKPKKPEAPTKKSTDAGSAAANDSNAALLAQLEATRMLLQGFARRNARRSEELRELEEKARNEMAMGKEFLRDRASRVVAGEAQ